MSLFGGIGDFFSSNFGSFLPSGSIGGGDFLPGWGLPATVIGTTLYDQYRQRQQADDLEDALREQAQQQWERGQANYNAYQDYLGQYYGGHGVTPNAAGFAPNEFVANEALLAKIPELKATIQAGTDAAVETLRPFRDINEAVLPKMLSAYAKGLGKIPEVSKAVFSPAAMELLGVNASPMKQNLGLSDYLRGR